MTTTTLPPAGDWGGPEEQRRWGIALGGVLGLHVAAIAIAAQWQVATPPRAEEQAIAVELAALPVADHLASSSSSSSSSAAAAPAPSQAVPQPQMAAETPRPVVHAEVPLPPAPVPPPAARPAPQALPAPLSAPAAVVSGAAGNGASPSAGAGRSGPDGAEPGARGGPPGRPREGGGDAAAVWRGRVLAHLERHKRYPAAARMMKREGRVQVSVTMDRRGHVLSVAASRGTGFKPFDTEAVDTVRRADPLPEPPAELAGNTISLQLPIGFYLPR